MSTLSPPQPVPRNPRRLRYYLAGFLLLMAATLVGYYFVAGWLADRELQKVYRELDADDPNWRWNDLIAEKPMPPDDRNAALQVRKVSWLLKISLSTLNSPIYLNARLSKAEKKSLRDPLGDLDPGTIEEARKLKDLPDGRYPVPPVKDAGVGSGINLTIRYVMMLLQHDAILRANDGNIEEAGESCQALLHTTYSLDGYPAFMACLLRMAGRELALATLERVLASGVVSRERLRMMQGALEREARSDALYHAMRGERALRHECYLLLKKGEVSHKEMLGGLKTRVPTQFYDLFPSLLLLSHGEELRLQTEQVHASKLRDEAQMAAMQAVAQKMKKNADITTPFTLRLIADMTQSEQRTQAKLRCAITALAAERFRLERGDWPRGADDLVKAGMLKETPMDPYGGQPLLWKRTTTGIIVHSIGPDKIDHGGKLSRGSALAAPATNWGFELWSPEFRGVPAPAEAEK